MLLPLEVVLVLMGSVQYHLADVAWHGLELVFLCRLLVRVAARLAAHVVEEGCSELRCPWGHIADEPPV